jgi:ABC-type antimicrobial peptide transport system permease subunit
MEETLSTASATPRFQTLLIVGFAGVAMALALAGVYGLMTYVVNQRVPEFGVRIALGATASNILRLIVLQGATLAAVGLVVGLILSVLSARWLEGLLFGVPPRDPLTLVAVSAAVALVTLLACFIPGRRAARVDPMIALRAE